MTDDNLPIHFEVEFQVKNNKVYKELVKYLRKHAEIFSFASEHFMADGREDDHMKVTVNSSWAGNLKDLCKIIEKIEDKE